jgi:hypothetical protein
MQATASLRTTALTQLLRRLHRQGTKRTCRVAGYDRRHACTRTHAKFHRLPSPTHGTSPTTLARGIHTHAALTTSPTLDQVRLLRACTSVVVLYFTTRGSGIDCLTDTFVASKADGIRLYHLTRKEQHGVSVNRKLLCYLHPHVHNEVIQVSMFFDSLRPTILGGKCLGARWKIDLTKKHDGWLANTLTC